MFGVTRPTYRGDELRDEIRRRFPIEGLDNGNEHFAAGPWNEMGPLHPQSAVVCV
jgi:hypothetical protein